MACYPCHCAARAQAGAREHRSAYLLHKNSAAISPGVYPSWLGMGNALFAVGAYEQAPDMFIQAGTRFPAEQTAMDNEGFDDASLSRTKTGKRRDPHGARCGAAAAPMVYFSDLFLRQGRPCH